MHKAKTIFLVEDDIELARLTTDRLDKEGFAVLHEIDGKVACERILRDSPDLVVLDIMLPGMDGFDVCRNIRPAYKGPILILTARDSDLDQILGLELGADDFVIKPVRPQVLLARVRALFRRADQAKTERIAEPIRVGDLNMDPSRREAALAGVPIDLTTVEFELLWYLVSNVGRVVSRNDIHLALYQTEYDGLDRSIDVYVSRLRNKLRDNPSNPRFLKTVRGTGYLFAGEKA
jgi:DNA-binding response OmpR family regulator